MFESNQSPDAVEKVVSIHRPQRRRNTQPDAWTGELPCIDLLDVLEALALPIESLYDCAMRVLTLQLLDAENTQRAAARRAKVSIRKINYEAEILGIRPKDLGLDDTPTDQEITQTIAECRTKSEAARALCMGESTLFKRLRKIREGIST